MKILHVCLSCFYIDNNSYQENMLPKYHKVLGNEVEIIASHENFDINGKKTNFGSYKQYFNEHNIKVTRLDYSKLPLSKVFKKYINLKQHIEEFNPDIIFVHGSQFIDLKVIKKYCINNKNVKLYIDNHADFSNSASNFMSKHILHSMIWRKNIKTIIPYTEKVYGVMPSRVDFLIDIYKVPAEKVDLLLMGVDDLEIIESKKRIDLNKTKILNKYKIDDSDFVIVTGGKIDKAKPQIISLMKNLKDLGDSKIKLIIFGSVIEEMKNEFESLIDDNSIIFVGWLSPEETYDLLYLSNLVIFPGRHSVLWEQVVGMGKPAILKLWNGTEHINPCNNIDFIIDDKDDAYLRNLILKYVNDSSYYHLKKKNALKAAEIFSYKKIAIKSIQ